MTDKQILDKLQYLKHYKIPETKKIEFIKKLYKLAHISFDQYIKNGQTDSNK